MKRIRERKGISFENVKGRTIQSDKDTCNINSILRKFATTGLIDHVRSGEPVYGDISEVPDFATAMNARALSLELYEKLPKKLKKAYSYEELTLSNEFSVEIIEALDKIEKKENKNEQKSRIDDKQGPSESESNEN